MFSWLLLKTLLAERGRGEGCKWDESKMLFGAPYI
jgi:hypothetical protein